MLRVDSLHAYVLTCALACKLTCLHAYTLTCVHAYMHVRTCLHAYMLICLRLCFYMLTCLHVYLRPHVVRHWPTLTIIWHHVTPIWLPYQDAPLQQALGIHFDSWFLHFGFRFSHWFSIRSFSKYFRLFRRFPGAQGSPARLPNYRILIFSRTHANHPLLAKVSWAR